jgi:hypothetical protein
MKPLKLRELVEGIESRMDPAVHEEGAWSVEEKKLALEAIARYNEYGRQLARESSLMEIAHNLSEVAKHAQRFLSKELEENARSKEQGWFDAEMPKRNMKELSKCSEEFNKYAMEAHVLEQRMQALYEEMGGKLSKYFEIKDLKEGQAAVSKLK